MRRTSRREPSPFPGMRNLTTLYCGRSALLYRAERESDRAPVVVKLLGRAPGTAGPDEAGLWDRLTPVTGIQPLLSSGVTGAGRAFAVTEYRGGGDYARALAEGEPLMVDEVLTVGRTVARALEGMHELGLLHHAVSPGNILRGDPGPTLTDFGSALPLGHPFPPVYYTRATLDHAPPEEVGGSRPTPASDVYRLASTLWTLLAGHAPFADPDNGQVDLAEYRSRVLSGTPPEMHREDVPDWLRDVLLQALAADPGLRTPTAADFGEALESGAVAQDTPDAGRDRAAAAVGSEDAEPEPEASVGSVPALAAPASVEADTGAGSASEGNEAQGPEPEPETPTEEPVPEASVGETTELDGDTRDGPDDDGYTDGAWYDDDDEDNAWYEVDDDRAESGEPVPADDPSEAKDPVPADSPPGTDTTDATAELPGTGEPAAAAAPTGGRFDGSGAPSAGLPAPLASSTSESSSLTPSPPVSDRPGTPSNTGPTSPTSRPPSAERATPSPFSFEAVDRGAPPLTNHPSVPSQTWSGPEAQSPRSAPRASPRTGDVGSAWTDQRHAHAHASSWAPPAAAERNRTAVLIPVLIGLVLVTVVAVGALLITGRGSGAPSAEASDPAESGEGAPEVPGGTAGAGGDAPSAGAATDIAPTGVEVSDDLVGVSLSWTDNTGGATPHFVVGGPVGARTTSMANVSAGASTVDVSGLNPEVEYCFRVVAVQSTDVMAPSEEVCTARGAAGG
ncbi:protein kinase [Nocardiopsis sp. NPDC058631]|uniref:protein kinase domain-containing protein n=1 Tax=Nocardiopsis sp. NPDC058631 TaxID=3346566 RepID=UPI00365B29E4